MCGMEPNFGIAALPTFVKKIPGIPVSPVLHLLAAAVVDGCSLDSRLTLYSMTIPM